MSKAEFEAEAQNVKIGRTVLRGVILPATAGFTEGIYELAKRISAGDELKIKTGDTTNGDSEEAVADKFSKSVARSAAEVI